MKKSLGLKICAGLLAVPILGTFCRGAFATTNSILKVGAEDIYPEASETKTSNEDGTATYDKATKTLTLKGYTGKAIDTDIDTLIINITEDSKITDTVKTLHSAGNVTINGSKKLTLSNGIDVEGSFTLESASIDLGTTDLTAKGKISINGAIKAGSISLTAADITKGKIMFGEKADVNVSKDITANYTSKVSQLGIELNKVCANAKIININNTGKTATTTTVFSTDETTGVTKGVKISSALCEEKGTNDKVNPDTADSIYFYVAALVASSAILVYRRHLAKR